MENMSLILGTLLSQLAVGTFITGYVIDQLLGRADEKKAFMASLVAFVAGCCGVIAVFTHLGVPTRAFNAIFNIGRSWLSRESLFFALFLLLVFIYLLIRKGILMKENKGALKWLGCLASVVGIILLFVVPMIYMLPGVPAWNTAATPISFILSAFLMGIPLGVWLSGFDGGSMTSLVTAMCALSALCVAVVNVTALQAGNAAQSASGYLMSGNGMFTFRLILLAAAVIFCVWLGIKGMRKEGTKDAAAAVSGVNMFLILFCVLAVSEILGRLLFFGTIVRY